MDLPDAPSLALYDPVHRRPSRSSIAHAPKHLFLRSVKNLRQGNLALFIVFCGCLIIFLRAIMGVGYDEGLSADADALHQQHPSLLARWGPQSQKMLEEQWARLRRSSGSGLRGKIQKEDAAKGRQDDTMVDWLRGAGTDRGLGRRPSVAQPPKVVPVLPEPVALPDGDATKPINIFATDDAPPVMPESPQEVLEAPLAISEPSPVLSEEPVEGYTGSHDASYDNDLDAADDDTLLSSSQPAPATDVYGEDFEDMPVPPKNALE